MGPKEGLEPSRELSGLTAEAFDAPMHSHRMPAARLPVSPLRLGGNGGNRTRDPRLAKPMLSPLSYVPIGMVGTAGFEPAPPCAQGRCATRLRYAPMTSFAFSAGAKMTPRCRSQAIGRQADSAPRGNRTHTVHGPKPCASATWATGANPPEGRRGATRSADYRLDRYAVARSHMQCHAESEAEPVLPCRGGSVVRTA